MPVAKRHLENLKFYKAIKGGQFLDTIVEPTEPNELIQKDLAHNESGVWRRVRHTKTSEQGKSDWNTCFIQSSPEILNPKV